MLPSVHKILDTDNPYCTRIEREPRRVGFDTREQPYRWAASSREANEKHRGDDERFLPCLTQKQPMIVTSAHHGPLPGTRSQNYGAQGVERGLGPHLLVGSLIPIR